MSNLHHNIAFVGAGNLAGSIIRGLISQGFPASAVQASAPSAKNLTPLVEAFGIEVSHDNSEIVADADIVVLGVKPQIMAEVCQALRGKLAENALVISLAAGTPCAKITQWLDGPYAVVRCMSNTPAKILQGASGLFANAKVSSEQKNAAETIVSSVGLTCWVDEEALIDSVTAVAGSGPAYFFLFMEAMIDAAVEQGMERDVATKLAIQTGLGAATLAKESEHDLVELRRQVTSPKGTTEQAILSFESDALRDTVTKAMKACVRRAKELAAQD